MPPASRDRKPARSSLDSESSDAARATIAMSGRSSSHRPLVRGAAKTCSCTWEAPNVSDEKRAAVTKAAEEIGYRPNAVARSLVRRRSYLIGVMVSDLHNPYFTEVIDGIQEAARGSGYHALFNTGGRAAAGEDEALDTLLQLRTDGIVMAGPVLSSRRIAAVAALPRVGTIGVGITTLFAVFDSFDAIDEEQLRKIGETRQGQREVQHRRDKGKYPSASGTRRNIGSSFFISICVAEVVRELGGAVGDEIDGLRVDRSVQDQSGAGIDGERAPGRGDAGEADDAVGTGLRDGVNDQLAGPGALDDDVGVEPDSPHAAPRRRAASSRFLHSTPAATR